MIYIVGSGPTGVATAQILLAKGLRVTILDAGIALEKRISENVQSLKSQEKGKWNETIISSFKDKLSVDAKGVQKKLIYGSDYPYQGVEKYFNLETVQTGSFTPSFAKAGFSNVWGSAILPYTSNDISDWPITIDELEKYYKSVLSFMPIAGSDDDFKSHFPIYTNKIANLNASKQASYLLERFEKNKTLLAKAHVFFSKARLAVNAMNDNCVYCGLCLFGCPKQIIYSTNSTLQELESSPNFSYIPNIIVTDVDENPSEVEINAYNRESKEKITFKGDKCFIAAGVLSTTKILLKSKSAFDKKIILKASEYFLAPVFSKKAFRKVENESLHTLAQIFLEVLDPELSQNFIHLQLYGYSELYKVALNRMLRWIAPIKNILLPEVLGRMMAVQGYLHSNVSSHIELSLKNDKIILNGKINPHAKEVIHNVVKKINSLRKISDLFIFKPMLQIGLPGEGRHVGGSFPMSNVSAEFTSDTLGRPFGWKNIHVVDSSVFPNVPAPTITFTAMANAQRIADISV